MDIMMEHLGRGFLVMLLISMPIVLAAALIGLIIGIIQAVTQVQEQTISAAPKILGVFLVIVVMSGFFTKLLIEYTIDSTNIAFNIIPKQDEYLLPPEGELSKPNFFDVEKDYANLKRPNIEEIRKYPGKVPYSDKKEKFSIIKSATPASEPNLVEKRKMYTGR